MRADLSAATPVFVDADQFGTSSADLAPGTVHLAVPFDDNWHLRVDGEAVEPRRAFGATTAFDVPVAGAGELRYETPASRTVLVAFQVLLWLLVIVGVSRVKLPTARRPDRLVEDETLIDLSEAPDEAAPFVDPGLAQPGPTTSGAPS